MHLPVERPEARAFLGRPITRGEVELRDVTFTYPGARTPALAGLSLKVAGGERVAVIGRVGSGKTTLGRLLIGLYEPAAGAVLLDGVDARQIDPADLRRGVGLVMQDVVLFQGTLRENIAMGQPQADDAAILAAARLAGVDDFAAAHPEGYAMAIAERGQNLSGGQRQAVALARALLLDPPVLMLDEPTSAMDNAAEQLLMQRLKGLLDAGRRTLILTTHRLSLVKLADRLVVLEGGRVLADGPREEVLRRLQDRGLARAAGTGEAAQRVSARAVVRAAAVRREPPDGAPQ
jgi:ATP-binding cassette subfamily C protein LapB